ncbi:isoprenylcysteine carboxylmethyltransferase family protein [Brevibacterium samyangense]|uniref:Isoprenylcysteine carboxylmethyltransferase family protein n=1 Tax=Brevibacterium samyangense TaxID=366888 RepID=A0ABP5EQM6_9MICO
MTDEGTGASPRGPRLQLLARGWFALVSLAGAAIVWIEHRWQLHLELPSGVQIGGLVLLIAASALGTWSAVTMTTRGEGTPLPSALPRRLVAAGPYRLVRNPMAVAGIAQAVAVGLLVGSWLVVAYGLVGSLMWNFLVRPHEEADLAARFGEEFEEYRRTVGIWVPRLR